MGRNQNQSRELMDRARAVTPGGINSWARKQAEDIVWDRADGSKIYDVDGNEYIDFVCGWGPIILGHCDEELNQSVFDTVSETSLYSSGTTTLEIEAAEAVKRHVPSAESVLFGVSGSEATGSAVRLARAITDRQKIIKFDGMFHGSYDSLAMNHMTDPEDLGTPTPFTTGLVPSLVDETIVLPFNDPDAVRTTIDEQGDDIAAIIVEPVGHNMGCVVPDDGYLEFLREITEQEDIILIFDEVITGFRHDLGGVQRLEGVTPDLTTLAKAVANGYPGSILCGKREYMEQFGTAADGDVMWGGTYNASPTSIGAIVETIRLLEERNVYSHTFDLCDRITSGLEDLIEDHGVTATVQRYGGVWVTYFMEPPVRNYRDVLRNDVDSYEAFRSELIEQGVYVTTKNARRNYLSNAHTKADADRFIEAADVAFEAVK